MENITHSDFLNLTHLNGQRNVLARTLKRKIRQAEEPDNPELIIRYLKLSGSNVNAPVQTQRQCLLTQFYLFIETMADKCLPLHWRCLCLDHIHKPLFALQGLAKSEESEYEVRLLFQQLKVSGDALQAEVLTNTPYLKEI